MAKGSHVVQREYAFVAATAHNRRSLLAWVQRAFRHLGASSAMYSGHDYLAFLTLVCPVRAVRGNGTADHAQDLPESLVRRTMEIALVDGLQSSYTDDGDAAQARSTFSWALRTSSLRFSCASSSTSTLTPLAASSRCALQLSPPRSPRAGPGSRTSGRHAAC